METKSHLVAPSLLSSNFLELANEIDMLNKSKADWFHLDIMDGRFVPNITFGFEIIKQIRTKTQKTLDTHLMIVEPEKYIERFREAGADIITVHYEASNHLHRLIYQIKETGAKAGVAINPHTPICVLEETLPFVDMVLIMSVNPGFGGQKFITTATDKVAKLDRIRKKHKYKFLIEVDGGVNLDTGKILLSAGANILVAGSFIFGSENPTKTIEQLKIL